MRKFIAAMVITAMFIPTVTIAQTPPIDDCPAGAELHKALTGLDHTSMLAAYTASFVGLFHRQPTMQPGSGSDDGEYWIATFNHYGPYGDAVCRAGWNAYAELRLGGAGSGDPKLGDQPAKFQPLTNTTPQPPAPAPQPVPTPAPVPVPTPVPAPVPSTPSVGVCDANCIANIIVQLDTIKADVDAGRAENQQFYSDVKSTWGQISPIVMPLLKYVAPAVVAYLAGKHL